MPVHLTGIPWSWPPAVALSDLADSDIHRDLRVVVSVEEHDESEAADEITWGHIEEEWEDEEDVGDSLWVEQDALHHEHVEDSAVIDVYEDEDMDDDDDSHYQDEEQILSIDRVTEILFRQFPKQPARLARKLYQLMMTDFQNK